MTRVETTTGTVRGRTDGGVAVFKGIPYATQPVGDLRFRAPRPHPRWSGELDATSAGPMAMQVATWTPTPPMGEDCLVLNLWTPGTDRPARPVMVWLHGGAFREGAGDFPVTDGSTLAAEQDVVVVQVNHRLGAFGYVYLGGLAPDEQDSANLSLLDIVAALTWIRDNAAAFGGDPENITVFGVSGGGWKISTLLAMPAARGLFHKAIVQSGSYLRAMPAEVADRKTRWLLGALGIPEAEYHRIRGVPASELAEVTTRVLVRDRPGVFHPDSTWQWNLDFPPIIDGRTLARHPFVPDAPPTAAGVPMLIGTTKDEMGVDTARLIHPDLDTAVGKLVRLGLDRGDSEALVAVYRELRPGYEEDALFGDVLADALFTLPAIRQAEAVHAQGGRAYLYRFDRESPVDHRAAHGADVAYAFGNLGSGAEDNPTSHALSARMRAAWAAFARTGAPGHPGLPGWPAYTPDDRATMILDQECAVVRDPHLTRRRALESHARGRGW